MKCFRQAIVRMNVGVNALRVYLHTNGACANVFLVTSVRRQTMPSSHDH